MLRGGWLVVVVAPLVIGQSAAAAAPATRPNIVFVLADDLGYGDLGCYGHPAIKTPHLDQFAQQGLRFTDCHSAGSVCSPSRSAILTGRTPYRNGVFTWIPEGREIHLRRSEISLATLLKQQGYATCHVGKWHLNGHFNKPEHPQPIDHGYQWWLATQNNAAPSHKNPTNFVRNGAEVGPLEGYSSLLVADEAVRWLKEQRDPQRPFLLSVWTHEPHLPIESDPRFMDLYRQFDDPELRQHHGNVSQLDAAFGRLMAALDELKLTENTFVVFTSDNGPEGAGDKARTRGSTGGLRGRKRDMYEGGHRVPGMVRWPGNIRPGTTSDTPIIGSDWFTTICQITGTAAPSDRTLDGANIVPTFTGMPIERRQPMFWRYPFMASEMKMALRDGDWKILANATLDKFEFYNLRRDRDEQHELSAAEPERLAALKARLIEHNRTIEAEGPDWWKNYSERLPGQGKNKAKAKEKL